MKTTLLTLPDNDLQNLVAKGNRAAFDIIFDRYWKKLYNYAYSIYREETICEDIVQELFISLWNNAGSSVILNLEAYLMRAVKYKVANHIRSLKFREEHLEVLDNMPLPAKQVNELEYREFEQGLMDEIEKLSPKCREVFIMSRFEQCSNSEIAKKLGLSIHTVEKHISNAIKHLRNNAHILQLSVFIIALFC